ncbi:MAG: hypothetical protein ACOCRO_05825 [Halanaerobiales bacterium]
MYKSKTIISIITSLFLFSSILFSSCTVSSGEENGAKYDFENHFTGVKAAYAPDTDQIDMNNEFTQKFVSQVELFSEELLVRLASNYSLGVEDEGYTLDNDETISTGGLEPIDNNYSDEHDEIIINQDIFDAELEDEELVINDSEIWSWDIDITGNEQPNELLDDYIQDYVDDFIVAVTMIKEGKDLSKSENYEEYLTKTEEDEDEIINYIEQVSLTQRSTGFNTDMTQSLKEFISERVIGTPYSKEQEERPSSNEFFKNYSTVIDDAIEKVVENEQRYKKHPFVQFRDYDLDNIELNDEEDFPIETGSQMYTNLILMNDEKIDLKNLYLLTLSEENINFNIYAKFFDYETQEKTSEKVLEQDFDANEEGVLELNFENDNFADIDVFQNETAANSSQFPIDNDYDDFFKYDENSGHIYNDSQTDYLELSIEATNTDGERVPYKFSLFGIEFNSN